MENIQTLTQLLQSSGCQYRIFDLGRRIIPIESKLFSSVEQAQQSYPFPLQKQAQFAIVYWNQQRQPWIWFLKFPLDERGLLKQFDIGSFIKYVIEAVGTHLNNQPNQEQQQKLADNPYTFNPTEEKLAVFHSQVRVLLDIQASQYYERAQHYFSGALGWDKWQTVGLQGVADICTRLNQQQNELTLCKALQHLPNEPKYALLGSLEHIKLPEGLADSILKSARNECGKEKPDLFLISAFVRALSGSGENQLATLVSEILNNSRLSHQEVLIGIAGRSWQILEDTALAELFLLRLAQTENQSLFNRLFADLVMIPALRMVFLPLLHGNPSQELATALLKLQQATKSKVDE